MPPEEQPSLKEVERTARWRNAARRRAAREEMESTEAQDQPDLEPAIQEPHQATLDAGTRDGSVEEPPKGSERDPVEPPVVDATSEASRQYVFTLDDNSTGDAQNRDSRFFVTTIVGSDKSSFNSVSRSRSSGKESSSSSMWSFGEAPVGAHMPYAGATEMVVAVQDGVFRDADPMGV
ncbi:unnamed protein product [Phytophthora fragariaefolia]|uniref:Unnamed protein product n=1 Tax=Phytophthora fragariaefolia TaxID=1490495 RepID=A0A9W7CSS1_9STRA|nr:unnamed protein product [Phytophthora fragariaefolia]